MAELNTKKTVLSAEAFLKKVPASQRNDAQALCDLMQKVSKKPPRMWGASIVGFGDQKLKYESGRELDWFVIGFSPRKQNLVLYLPLEKCAPWLEKLGKHKTGKGCLYIKTLGDIDAGVLNSMLAASMKKSNA